MWARSRWLVGAVLALVAVLAGCGAGGLRLSGSANSPVLASSAARYRCPERTGAAAPVITTVALGPRGEDAYVICGGHSLVDIDLATGKPRFSVGFTSTARSLVVSSDGSVVYVDTAVQHMEGNGWSTDPNSGSVEAVSTRTHAVIGRTRLPGVVGGDALVLGPGGRHLYVGQVCGIDVIGTATMTIGTVLPNTPAGEEFLAVSPDGRTLYAASPSGAGTYCGGTPRSASVDGNSYIDMIDIATGMLTVQITSAALVAGLAPSPNSDRLYVTYNGGTNTLNYPWLKVFSRDGVLLSSSGGPDIAGDLFISGKTDIGYVVRSQDHVDVYDMRTMTLVAKIPNDVAGLGGRLQSLSANGERLALISGYQPRTFGVVTLDTTGVSGKAGRL